MPHAIAISQLSIFQQQLIGTWTNRDLPGTGKGGPNNPYSYNVITLPQDSPQDMQKFGYILKNFTYHETIRFNGPDALTIPVAAPNRGGNYQQTPMALFYDQQVRFAEGPGAQQIVHEENGAWLYLQTESQPIGPYPYPPNHPRVEPGKVPAQPAARTIAKQISIPHGVSLLALGNFSENPGAPTIADGPSVLPTPPGLDTAPYTHLLDAPDNYQNPQPPRTANVHLPLQEAISDLAAAGTPVNKYIYCQVDTNNGGGVLNIPFEDRKAKLDGYSAEYWVLSTDGGANYDIIAYTQTIILVVEINGKKYTTRRPTTNVISRVK